MTKDMKATKLCFILLVSSLFVCACNKDRAAEYAQQDDVRPFTFTAIAGADTRVTAEFGSSENIIDFKWSDGDCLDVCFVETDELENLAPGSWWEGDTYRFELKSGAGTSTAVFQSIGMNVSDVLKDGVEYTMYAAYNPTVTVQEWQQGWGYLSALAWVNQQQAYSPDDPLGNVAASDKLVSFPVSVYRDDVPELSFIHGITVYRIRVKNTGLDPLAIRQIEYPANEADQYSTEGGGNYPTGMYAPNLAAGYTSRHFGVNGTNDAEVHGTLTMPDSFTLAPDETVNLYIPMTPCFVQTADISKTHIITLSDDRTIKVVKNPPLNFKLQAGHMYTTTLSVRSEMATSGGEIPSISGNDEDDF